MGIHTSSSSSSSSILDPCLHSHRSDNRVASGSSNSDHHHYGHHYDGHHPPSTVITCMYRPACSRACRYPRRHPQEVRHLAATESPQVPALSRPTAQGHQTL